MRLLAPIFASSNPECADVINAGRTNRLETRTGGDRVTTQEKTIRPRLSPGSKLVLGWIAILFVVPAVLYVAYVVDQVREIEGYSVRLLNSAAQRLEGLMGGSETTIESLTRDFRFAASLPDRQPFLGPAKISEALGDLTAWEKQLRKKLQEQSPGSSPAAVLHRPELKLATGFFVDEFDLLLGAQVKFSTPPSEGEPARPETARFAFRVLVEELFDRLYFGDVFDTVVLADAEGKVVLEQSNQPRGEDHGGLRLTRIDRLVAEGFATATKNEPEETTYEQLVPTSLAFSVELVEEDFRLLCQPVGLNHFASRQAFEDPAAGAHAVTWALCGLVASDQVLRRALGVAPNLALGLFLLLILGVLTWPLIKLFFMDRRERLKLVDAYLLWLSTFVLLVLAPILLYDADSYRELHSRFETSLANLAADVEGNFLGELSCLHGQLEVYDQKLCGDDTRPPDGSEAVDLLVLDPEQRKSSPRPVGEEIPELELPKADYPYFTSVFWMDEEGWQFAKGAIRGHNTPPVRLARRQYFQAVRDNRLWSFDSASEALKSSLACPQLEPAKSDDLPPRCRREARDFFFQTYDSLTTGKRSSSLSIRSRLSEPEALVAAAITSEPISVMHPVLPPGYGFAIIDAGGLSLFHSDPKLALQENLFERVDDQERLRSAMLSRSSQTFASWYHTRPHLLHVRPLEVVPWWIVTFYEKEILGTVNLEAVAHTLIVALTYVFLFTLLPFIYGVVCVRHTRWLWPDEAKLDLYRRLTWQFALLLTAFALLLSWLSVEALGWVSVVFAGVAGAATIAHYGYWKLREKGRTKCGPARRGSQLWHVAAVVLLWFLLAVGPAVSLFRAAWREQIETLAKYEGIHLMDALAVREEPLGSLYAGVKLPDGFLDQRRRHLQDVYLRRPDGEPSVLHARMSLDSVAGADDAPARASDRWLLSRAMARFKPIYNRSSRALRYLVEPEAEGRLSSWRHDRSITLQDAAPAAGRAVRVTTSLEDSGPWIGWVLGLGGLVVLVLTVVWVRYSDLAIFLIRIGPQADPLDVSALARTRAHMIALVAAPQDYQEILASTLGHPVDLGGEDREATEEQIRSIAPDDARPVICEDFDSDLADPQTRAWKLRTLEGLLATRRSPLRPVIVPTAAAPFERLLRTGTAPDQATAGNGAMRWGRLLSELELVSVGRARERSPETADPEAGERALERWEGYYWALWNACSPDEQLVLVHLAKEKFVNPKQWRTVRLLLQRGLVVRDPMLRLSDDSFMRFVLRVYMPQEIARWESEIGGLGWHQLRWALLSVLGVIALFLFATQQAFMDATLGFLSALTLGVPGLFKAVGAFSRGGRDASG